MRFRFDCLFIFFFLIVISLFDSSATVFARSHTTTSKQQQHKISQQQAANIAQRHVSGRVLSVGRSAAGYRVKILNSKGNIQVVTVADDGAVLSTR